MRQINLRMSDEDIASIDSERGMIPREAWLRHLIALGRTEAHHARAHRAIVTDPSSGATENRADAFRRATQGKKR